MSVEHHSHAGRDATGEVAYILKGFPRLSETFIANEIQILESMGLAIRIFSVKAGDTDKVHGVVKQIRAPIVYLPETSSISDRGLLLWLTENIRPFARAHWRLVVRSPIRYGLTLAQAIGFAWQYRRRPIGKLRKVFIKEFIQAGAIAAAINETPGVRHLHGHFCHGATTITWFVSRFTGLRFSFTAHAKDIYQSRLNPGNLLARKISAARFIATCTAANARHLRGVARNGCAHLHTIYHGLDLQRFAPAAAAERTGQWNDPPVILAVGRLVEKKGFDTLIEACAAMRNSGTPFRCVIVGEPGDAHSRLVRMIATLDLGACVTLQGPVPQEELVGIYRQAAVFALPCQVTDDGDRDGIPNVLAEAMAMGIPVVSTPISGIPELIDDLQDGLLVPDRDPRALAGALQRLLRDATLRARLGANARRKIQVRFDSRRTTQELHRLLQEAVGRTLPATSLAIQERLS